MKLKSKLVLLLVGCFTIIAALLIFILLQILKNTQTSNLRLINNELLETGAELHHDAASLFFQQVLSYLDRDEKFELSSFRNILKVIDKGKKRGLIYDFSGKSLTEDEPDEELRQFVTPEDIQRIVNTYLLKGETTYELNNFSYIIEDLEDIRIPVQATLMLFPDEEIIVGYCNIFRSMSVRLGFINSANEKNSKSLLIYGIIYFLSGGFLLLFFTIILMRTLVTTPLSKLAEGFTSVASGKRDVKILFHRQDEIALLADSFNHMVAELNFSFNKVEKEIEERKVAELRLKRTLFEREILLKEIHHRLKNNLSIIYSMVELQKDYIEDLEVHSLLGTIQARIQSILLVHDKLYRSDNLSVINFRQYCSELLSHLMGHINSVSENIQIVLNVEEVYLHIDVVMPCGLIISELITNSLKHGFPSGGPEEINIAFNCDPEGRAVLKIKDNGIGISTESSEKEGSLGLLLVRSLTEQLNGECTIIGNGGVETVISFFIESDKIHFGGEDIESKI